MSLSTSRSALERVNSLSQIKPLVKKLPEDPLTILKRKIRRSKKDPIYFLKTFAIIKHPIRGKIKFDLWKFQLLVITDLLSNRFVSIRKSRQIGLSTVMAGYVRWLMLFNPDKLISIICITLKKAVNLLRKVKLIYRMLPEWLRPNVVLDNKKSMVLTNGSVCYALRSTLSAGRSESLSLLILDLARFINDVGLIWKAAYPTLSTGGCRVLLSTPNGINWFFKMHSGRKSHDNDFFAILLPWWLHPLRGQLWKLNLIRRLGGLMRFKQLHLVDFQSSGRSIVDLTTISLIESNIKKNFSVIKKNEEVSDLYSRIITRIANLNLLISRLTVLKFWIFDLPKLGKYYAMTCDTSSGVGDDNATIIIWDVLKYLQVRLFRGKVKPNIFAYIIYLVGIFYGLRFCIVERNKDGSAVNQKLLLLRYPGVYHTLKSKTNLLGLVVEIAGVLTTGKSRPIMVSRMCLAVSKKHSVLKSLRLVLLLKTFVDSNGRAQRLKGYNDDLVMRFCIFRYLRNFCLMRKSDNLFVNRFSSGTTNAAPRPTTSNKRAGWVI